MLCLYLFSSKKENKGLAKARRCDKVKSMFIFNYRGPRPTFNESSVMTKKIVFCNYILCYFLFIFHSLSSCQIIFCVSLYFFNYKHIGRCEYSRKLLYHKFIGVHKAHRYIYLVFGIIKTIILLLHTLQT